MFKNNIGKFIMGSLTAGLLLIGVIVVPGYADAKMNADAKFHNDTNLGFVLGGNHFDFGMEAHVAKPAQKTFKQAVKNAKEDFKDAKKTAQVELKASVNADTSKPDRIVAIKAYFTKVLTALKAKNDAIEAAFQAFINTNFSI